MALRLHFQEKLAEIRREVIRMGGETNDMVRLAVEACVSGDAEVAHRVIEIDDEVDAFEKSIFGQSVLVTMQESPVAEDLRALVTTMTIVGELENIGDDAVKLARRSTKIGHQFPTELKMRLVELGEAARRSLAAAIKLYSEYDPALADRIIEDDRAIDGAYSSARRRVFDLIRDDPSQTETLVRTIDAFHALEHVADHAVAIARRMKLIYGHLEDV